MTQMLGLPEARQPPSFEEERVLHVHADSRTTLLAAEAAVRLSGESIRDVATLSVARFAHSTAEAKLEALRLALAIQAHETAVGHK
jgi:hypothetical protein